MPSVSARGLWANSAKSSWFISLFLSMQWWCKWIVLLPREKRGVKLNVIRPLATDTRERCYLCPSCLALIPEGESLGEEGRRDVLFLWRQVPKVGKKSLEVKSSHQESKPWVTTGGLATRMGLPEFWNMVIYLVPRGVALKSVCGHPMSQRT